jgi:hypothetical protein
VLNGRGELGALVHWRGDLELDAVQIEGIGYLAALGGFRLKQSAVVAQAAGAVLALAVSVHGHYDSVMLIGLNSALLSYFSLFRHL